MTDMMLLPHMLALLVTSLTVIQTAVLIMAALAVMCLQLPNISFSTLTEKDQKSRDTLLCVYI